MKVLDLFSGLGGWGAAFKDRGHHVTTLDLDPRFGADIQADILNVNGLGRFDVILASPPCETFSVMTIGRYWTGGKGVYEPKNDRARHGLAIMHKTFDLIDKARPSFYVIENPRGVMRKVAPRPPTATTWYCRWGMSCAKPTDLWTNIGGPWPQCRNGAPDHERSPRGADAGTQRRGFGSTFVRDESAARIRARFGLPRSRGGSNHDMDRSAVRALIPYRLSLAVCLAAENGGRLG